MGYARFQQYCASGPLGMDPILLTEEEAMEAIYRYRSVNAKIVASWKRCDGLVRELYHNDDGSPTLYKAIEVHKGTIILPNDMGLIFAQMNNAGRDDSFVYGTHGSNMYGAKLQENIIQALARVVISDQLLEIEDAGIVTVGCTHDEILAVAPESEAESVYNEMIRIMSTTPKWAEGLPLEADGGFSRSYCK